MLEKGLDIYSIPADFPVQLVEDSVEFFPGEHARIEYGFDERNDIAGAKVHSKGSLSEPTLFHELGHLKLRFMDVPVFMVSPNIPSWGQYFLVVHDEYYAELLFDKLAPAISRRHVQDGMNAMQSPEELRRQLAYIPPVGSAEWYSGLVTIMQGEIARVVCERCPNLAENLGTLLKASKVLRGSVLERYIDGVRLALLSFPPLPNPTTTFSAEDKKTITNVVNRIMRIIFGPGVPRFEPAKYTIRYP